MADLGEEKSGVFGGIEVKDFDPIPVNDQEQNNIQNQNNVQVQEGVFGGVEVNDNPTNENASGLPVKIGFWAKFKAFWLQDIDWNREIKVQLTPYQQKVEDEINEFLHQDITWGKVHDFLFQEVSFSSKK